MTFLESASLLIFTIDIIFLVVGCCYCKEKKETGDRIEHV